MLSEENINKLKINGLYKCEPNAKYRGRIHENNLYHCCNWTFRVKKLINDDFYMVDTYWSTGDNVCIKLTDENFDEFELIFEWDQVKKITEDEQYHYEKVYRVAVDSSGWVYPRYYVDVDSTKSKTLILDEINEKIRECESSLKYLKENKEQIENGTYNLEWY